MLPVLVTASWGHSPCTPFYTSPIPVLSHIFHLMAQHSLMQVLYLGPDYSLFILILHIKVFKILNVHTCISFLVKVVWKWWPSKLVKKSSGWIVFLLEDSDVDHPMLFSCCEQKLLVKSQHRTAHVWTQQIWHLSPHHRLHLWLIGS